MRSACLLIQTRILGVTHVQCLPPHSDTCFKSQSHMRSVPTVAKVVREKKVTQGFLKVGLSVCCPVLFGPCELTNKVRNFKRAADAEALSWRC